MHVLAVNRMVKGLERFFVRTIVNDASARGAGGRGVIDHGTGTGTGTGSGRGAAVRCEPVRRQHRTCASDMVADALLFFAVLVAGEFRIYHLKVRLLLLFSISKTFVNRENVIYCTRMTFLLFIKKRLECV